MQTYLELLQHVLDHGVEKTDRTGTGTRSVFGHQMRFDLRDGFPLLTTKKLHLRSIIYELLWFLRGDTNVKYLQDHGVSIWNEWADPETGELGPVYGQQWRSFPRPGGGEVDQIQRVIESLKHQPDSRRHIVCAWNPGQLDEMALPPCHCLFQFYVSPVKIETEGDRHQRDLAGKANEGAANRWGNEGGEGGGQLSCQLYQRSADVFLGVPFNIASYALLTQMVAQVCGLVPGELIHTLGDAHLYINHLDQARLQLGRTPRPAPRMTLNPAVNDLFDFTYEDFVLEDYDPYPSIKATIAV